jgi:hypothetical protein
VPACCAVQVHMLADPRCEFSKAQQLKQQEA